jgi:hypothetical protein
VSGDRRPLRKLVASPGCLFSSNCEFLVTIEPIEFTEATIEGVLIGVGLILMWSDCNLLTESL